MQASAESEPIVDLTPEPAAAEPPPEPAASPPEPESQSADPVPQVEMTASPTSRPPAARGTRRTTVDADEDVWEEPARQPEPRVKPRRDRRHRASCRSDGSW